MLLSSIFFPHAKIDLIISLFIIIILFKANQFCNSIKCVVQVVLISNRNYKIQMLLAKQHFSSMNFSGVRFAYILFQTTQIILITLGFFYWLLLYVFSF